MVRIISEILPITCMQLHIYPAGSYCVPGMITQTICPAGSYCLVNSQAPISCPAGTSLSMLKIMVENMFMKITTIINTCLCLYLARCSTREGQYLSDLKHTFKQMMSHQILQQIFVFRALSSTE